MHRTVRVLLFRWAVAMLPCCYVARSARPTRNPAPCRRAPAAALTPGAVDADVAGGGDVRAAVRLGHDRHHRNA